MTSYSMMIISMIILWQGLAIEAAELDPWTIRDRATGDEISVPEPEQTTKEAFDPWAIVDRDAAKDWNTLQAAGYVPPRNTQGRLSRPWDVVDRARRHAQPIAQIPMRPVSRTQQVWGYQQPPASMPRFMTTAVWQPVPVYVLPTPTPEVIVEEKIVFVERESRAAWLERSRAQGRQAAERHLRASGRHPEQLAEQARIRQANAHRPHLGWLAFLSAIVLLPLAVVAVLLGREWVQSIREYVRGGDR